MRWATYAAVAVATVLIAAKVVAYVLTDSVAMLSTLVDSLLDVGASIINLLAVRHALEPADREHRFGHGKAESIAGLAQAAFISGSAFFLLFQAGERLLRPRVVENSEAGIAVMALSIVLTLVLVAFQRYVVGKTGSVAISADSLHYKTDLLVNLGVVASLLLAVQLGWLIADPLFAIAIAGYILWGAWQIVRQSLDMLMDREFAEEDRKRIRDLVMAHPEVQGMHDLRTRTSGQQAFIQLHIEMAPEMRLERAHQIADEVMWAIEEVFPNAEVLVHQDPAGIDEAGPKFAQ
jgi:ferrous-iron efflux pump FieF